MTRLTSLIVLFAVVASSFAVAPSAEARTLNDIRRGQAEGAHAAAAAATARATRLNARITAEAAKFNVAMNSSNYNTRFYGKRAYIGYLQSLKLSIQQADRAHLIAMNAWQQYWYTSKNPVAQTRINQLAAARSGFAVTIGQIDARITMAAAMK